MALDIGSKTIGIAISDPLKIAVRPLTTLARRDLETDVQALLTLVQQHGIENLVVGMPLHLSGERSQTAEVIEPLVEQLRAIIEIPVVWAEERLSTKEAETLMFELGLRRDERRKRRNEFAAALILKWYLKESE